MINENKIILDLCGGTGAWSRPYKKAGYDVRLVTLPDNDVLTYDPPTGVYGILAAPPCTEFSLAKGSLPRDFEGAMNVISGCLRIIWKCRLNGLLKFWAMENPKGFLRQFLGIPHFQFEHWEFGDWQIKPTDLWGYFNDPQKSCFERPPMMTIQFPNGRTNGRGWAKPYCPDEYRDYIEQFHGSEKRAAIRAITPHGFAQAFFKANQ